MMSELIDFIGDLLYGRSGRKAHLDIRAAVEGDRVTLTLENRGKGKLRFAGVQVRGGDGKRHFPETDLAAQTLLAAGEPVLVSFAVSEVRDLHPCVVEVLDTSGRAWTMQGELRLAS